MACPSARGYSACLVPPAGLEPARPKAHDFKSCASTCINLIYNGKSRCIRKLGKKLGKFGPGFGRQLVVETLRALSDSGK